MPDHAFQCIALGNGITILTPDHSTILAAKSVG
jgi:hypothetical protein